MRANRQTMGLTDGAAVLTPRQRRTCALAWVENRSHSQMAAKQGVSHWATKKRVQRARNRLRAAGIEPPGDPRVLRRTPAFQLGPMENV